MTLYGGHRFALERCPHCSVAKPNFTQWAARQVPNRSQDVVKYWTIYYCGSCAGCVMSWSEQDVNHPIVEIWPAEQTVPEEVPGRARQYLMEAIASIHAPTGAVLLAGSAVDSMLKEKGYKDGSLYGRIDQAAKDHVITEDMAAWAHEVRLDANGQRHADENEALPNGEDALKTLDFANALAQLMFVLPSRVKRGRGKA